MICQVIIYCRNSKQQLIDSARHFTTESLITLLTASLYNYKTVFFNKV